jgi:hypothetical protein
MNEKTIDRLAFVTSGVAASALAALPLAAQAKPPVEKPNESA